MRNEDRVISASLPATLNDWLARIEQLHPAEIELGLERVAAVASRMGLLRPTARCITVAGTNGKGSCVATLEALLLSHGRRVGCHTSPHLLRYNERICINGQMVADDALIAAFTAIESARAEIPLTYFEFGTLAALYLFKQAKLDVMVLEVGLGGRLDAVNIIDADVAVVTSVDLDHQHWLGENREQIGREKAGIFRRQRPVVLGDMQPPVSVLDFAAELECQLFCIGSDFTIAEADEGWQWRGRDAAGRSLLFANLPKPGLLLSNVASALQALALVPVALQPAAVHQGLQQIELAARQQTVTDSRHGRELLLDVAHNPHAARALAQRLQQLHNASCRIHLLLAMMGDKDIEGFAAALETAVDFWYIAQVDQLRCLPSAALYQRLQGRVSGVLRGPFDAVTDAYVAACAGSTADDIIVVCGSFFTVSDMVQFLDDLPPRHPGR